MNDTDDADNDFLPAGQLSRAYGRSHDPGASTSSSSQNHRTSTSQGTSSQRSRSHGVSSQVSHHEAPTNTNRELQLAHLTQGLNFLRGQFEEFAKSEPRTDKKEDKKKKVKEQHKCQLCLKVLANKTNLFRHYKAIHGEFNPERFGYTVNDTVLNIDDSMTQEHRCGICGYVSGDKNSVDAHMVIVHSNDIRERCKVCGYKASSKDDLDNHSETHANNDSGTNSNVVETSKDRMYKCEECACYFDDKSKFDEHMKKMHGFEVLCKICNKNFRFKDFEGHVRDNHPDVYNDKDETVKKSNVIVEKNVRTKTGRDIVFRCTKCIKKFSTKKEAWRHAKIHKKELRSRTVSNSQAGGNSQNCKDVNTNKDVPTDCDIIYICEACNIATASYDVVVEHSQKHITNPDVQFSTNECDICNLKFEPICYEKHIDIHYIKKEVNKESFKYLKYKPHLLLTGDWLKFFDMAEEVVNRIVSRSIYAETRSIKMRVISGMSNTNTLYQCRQCDNFIEPSAITNHALNFDTCLRITHSFICNVCEKSFNTEIARDNHEAVHNDINDNERFRIVVFNNERDREFNHRLSEPVPETQIKENVIEKVIYKCRCGLCFVFQESANSHIKFCPGHGQKQSCRKCNNMFNLHELVTHCYEHHLQENIRLIIEDIVPDVIVVSDDESKNDDTRDAIEILSSDDEDENKNVKTKKSHNNRSFVCDDKENEPQASVSENVTQANVCAEESNIQLNLLVAPDTVRDDVPIPMDEDNESDHNQPMNDENSDHSDFEVSHDDDSQNTIISGEHNNINKGDIAVRNIKCVETNLLLNPFYVKNSCEKVIDAGERNNNLLTQIETMRLKIDAPAKINVKDEVPWYIDEDTYINWRPVNQPNNSNVTSTDTVIDLDEIMTDDEDSSSVNIPSKSIKESNVSSITNKPGLPGTANNSESTTDDSDVACNSQNDIISNSNIPNQIEETDILDSHNEYTMDIFRPNQMNAVINRICRANATLTEKRAILNTDNIKIEDETKVKLVRSAESENGRDDTEIEQILRPGDSTMTPFSNDVNDIENRYVVNNLEIQLAGQNVIMKPNCNIF